MARRLKKQNIFYEKVGIVSLLIYQSKNTNFLIQKQKHIFDLQSS